MLFDAIILAGGENTKKLTGPSPEPFEAMIDIGGRPMVAIVAEALRASEFIGSIYIVGPKVLSGCKFPPDTALLGSGATITEAICIGMNALGHSRKVMVVTADVPLLTPPAIDDFINRCLQVEADLYYPIVPRSIHETTYPGNSRTYARLKEGTFTGGNIFMVNPSIVPACLKQGERLIENRKNPLKLCHILGWSFVFQFLLGLLPLERVERRASYLLGIKGIAVLSEFPEVGLDVDKPSDLDFVRAILATGGEPAD